MPDTSLPESEEELGDDGTLVVEDQRFAIVGGG